MKPFIFITVTNFNKIMFAQILKEFHNEYYSIEWFSIFSSGKKKKLSGNSEKCGKLWWLWKMKILKKKKKSGVV